MHELTLISVSLSQTPVHHIASRVVSLYSRAFTARDGQAELTCVVGYCQGLPVVQQYQQCFIYFILLMAYVTSLNYLTHVDESRSQLLTSRTLTSSRQSGRRASQRLWQRARKDRPLDRSRVFADRTRTRTDVVADIVVLCQ